MTWLVLLAFLLLATWRLERRWHRQHGNGTTMSERWRAEERWARPFDDEAWWRRRR